ncbi:MAG: hypothetical protein JEZ07_13110 [Phycisphaerae bacterium]|nr:hypothetical protein [Phycisphaerae bacterium]
MFRGKRFGIVAFLMVGLILGGSAVQSKDLDNEVLKLVPANCNFCLKINGLDGFLTVLDSYLADVSPMPVKQGFYDSMKFIIGDFESLGIDANGQFAIFQVATPGTAGVFGIAIAVKDYDKLIEGAPMLADKGDKGISKILIDDETFGHCYKAGNYALIAFSPNYEKMAELEAKVGQRKLGMMAKKLDKVELANSAKEGIWYYANIQEAGKNYRAFVDMGLDQMEKEIAKAQAQSNAGFDSEAIMDMYRSGANAIFENIDHISGNITIAADSMKENMLITAVNGSDIYNALTAVPAGTNKAPGQMLSYFNKNNMINFYSDYQHPLAKNLMKCYYEFFMDIMATEGNEKQMEKLKNATQGYYDLTGETAVSFDINLSKQPIMKMVAVSKSTDSKKVIEYFKQSIEAWNPEMMAIFGDQLSFEMKWHGKTGSLDDIDIYKYSMQYKFPEEMNNNPALENMQEPMEIALAGFDDYYVYTMDKNSERALKRLVGKIKKGKSFNNPFIKEILDGLEGNNFALMTVNLVRVVEYAGDAAMLGMGKQSEPTNNKVKSALAVGIEVSQNGQLGINTTLPRQHLLETKEAIEKFIQSMQ